jgi:hypothetical protein
LSDLWGAAQNPLWRARKIAKDPDYPAVTASGFYFRKSSGGFVLNRRGPKPYVGFYTREAVEKLEAEYGARKTRRSGRRGSGDS